MAKAKPGKTKSKKTASEKDSSEVASKDSEKESKKSPRTPSSEKSTKEKRKKSSTSSQNKKKKHSSSSPTKVRVLEVEEDSSFSTNKSTSETEDENLETSKRTPSRDQGENDPASLSSPAELRVALADTAERLQRAEKQVRAISRTRIADSFQEGQVRSWTKETLWKQVKFITNDLTMNKIMIKAAKHFKVPTEEQEHWMSTYAHIVRDGLNQKRNACSQDLRKTIKSKYRQAIQYDW